MARPKTKYPIGGAGNSKNFPLIGILCSLYFTLATSESQAGISHPRSFSGTIFMSRVLSLWQAKSILFATRFDHPNHLYNMNSNSARALANAAICNFSDTRLSMAIYLCTGILNRSKYLV